MTPHKTTTATSELRHTTAAADRRLSGLLDGLAASKGVRHVVLAVESTDGTFHWAGARGLAQPDGTPMRADTPYYVASIDKLFTATLSMQLVERGLLELDAPIGTYLPETLVGGLHSVNGRDLSGSVTVRHLLSHTSGLASYLEDQPRNGKRLIEILVSEGDRAWSVEEVARIVREDLRPHFPPQPPRAKRQRIRYSDTNFALLQSIVEAVSGQALHEVLARALIEPLGLRHTWMAGHPRPEAAAEPAALWAGDRPFERPLAMRSLRGIYSNTADQLRFMRALAVGKMFDDPGTLGLMQARWNRFGLPLDPAALRAPSWPIEYGLGIKRFQLPRPLSGLKPMPPLFGHSGSTGTWLFHCPDLNLTIAGAVDQVTAGAVPYRFLPKAVRVLADMSH